MKVSDREKHEYYHKAHDISGMIHSQSTSDDDNASDLNSQLTIKDPSHEAS